MQRLTGHLGRLLRLSRNIIDTASHVQNRLAGFANLMQLLVRCCQQLGRCQIHLLCGLSHAGHRVLHRSHQRAQLFHRVVHRVGNRAGNVFGHGGFLCQITLGHGLQLVHQTQNGSLVGVVDALGFLFLHTGIHLVTLGFFLTRATVQQLHARNANTTEHGGQNGQRQQRQLQHVGTTQALQGCL